MNDVIGKEQRYCAVQEMELPAPVAAEVNRFVSQRFPVVLAKRHAFCKECGHEYGFTKRTYCPRCDTHTVDAWQFRFEKEAA